MSGEETLLPILTTKHLFIRKSMIQLHRELFIPRAWKLEKTYDRVPREELWYCMRKSGVAEKYVRVVQDMYERSRTVVRCAVGQTEEFKVEVGLHQGLALSPFLFAIVMDQLSEEVRQESPWTMMFADDIVICSESREQVEENLERWRFALERRKGRELADMMERRKVDILCVQETRWKGSKARGAGFKLFYYGVDSKRNGVGVVLKEEFVRNVLEVKRVLDRVMGTHVSDFQHISTGSPQGCVLSPLLFSLYTNGCTSGHQSVKLLKFADDTTLIGLISEGDKSAYRGEMDCLMSWCSMNNRELNSLKTVEMIVDFRKDPAPLPPVILCDSLVTSVKSFRFLGTTITQELKWEQNISSLTKKPQQRMYFLWQLKKFLLPVKMLVNFYTAIIESILTSSITVWFAAATARDKAKLQRVIHSAEKVIGCSLPSLQELYISRSLDLQPRLQLTPLILETNSFNHSPLTRGSGPSGPGPHATRTVSSPVSLLNSAPLTPR
ncbi:hypothetical protein QTP86_000471 [Hemibagrus guttatus]|nr:hypothetical protein QTP86_000471 [Hemibagrus guttatus]